jgi:hypothetical protein
MEGAEVWIDVFLTLALDGGEWLASCLFLPVSEKTVTGINPLGPEWAPEMVWTCRRTEKSLVLVGKRRPIFEPTLYRLPCRGYE